jgi:maleylpyruvate isomerase
VEIVNSGVQPLQNVRTLEALRKLGGESAAQTFTDDAISRGLAALEAHAAAHGGAFSVGDELSLADVFLVPQLYNARRYQVDISRYSRLLAIEARAAALPAFQLAHPDVQPDAPKKT